MSHNVFSASFHLGAEEAHYLVVSIEYLFSQTELTYFNKDTLSALIRLGKECDIVFVMPSYTSLL